MTKSNKTGRLRDCLDKLTPPNGKRQQQQLHFVSVVNKIVKCGVDVARKKIRPNAGNNGDNISSDKIYQLFIQ